MLQLHSITDWPNSSTDLRLKQGHWSRSHQSRSHPPLGSRYTLNLSLVLFSDICHHYSLKLKNSIPTNLNCNRLLLQQCSSVRYQKLLKRRFGMAGRKYSFTEQKGRRARVCHCSSWQSGFGQVAIHGLHWWTPVKASSLFERYQFPKGESTN